MVKMILILSGLLLLMHCGGTKVLTQSELEQLPREEQEKALINNIKKEPLVPNNYILLSNLYLEENQDQKAFLILNKGVKEIPQDTRLQFMFGQLAVKQGKLKDGYGAFLNVLNSPDGYTYKDRIAAYVQEQYSVQQITTDPADDAYPVFAPDGESIYFQSYRNGNWDIYRKNIINGEITQITTAESDEELPWVMADGNFLLYTSNELDKRPVSYLSKSRNIYKLDLTNNKVTPLTSTLANDWLARSNQQNTHIAFVSDRMDQRKVAISEKYSQIFIMEPNGDFQLNITDAEANHGGPVFSQNGRYLYFDSNKEGNFGIYRYSFTTEKTAGIFIEPGNDNVAPSVSPDDSSLVFFSNRDGNFELYRLNLTDNQLQRLTTNPASDLNPVFSPDGTKIVFFSNRSGNYDVYLLDLTQPAASITMNELIKTMTNLVNTMN